ncbi:MAG: carbohydrate ABC transporter permease [Bacteroidota bacterium]
MPNSGLRVDKKLPYLLIAPILVVLCGIILFPVADTMRISLFDASFLKPGLRAPFVGLGNYKELLRGRLFWRSLWITLKWTVTSVVFQFGLGLGLALLVNSRIRARNVIRSLFLIPWMLPGALAALMWKWMYHGSIGLLNYVLLELGIIRDVHPWLSDPSTALWSAVLVNVWRGSPFFMVMLLGGLQTVPRELYEAAEIDGAGPLGMFMNVTIPLLRPLMVTLLIFGTVGAFNFLDIIMVLTRGGPANHTMVLSLYAWLSAFFSNRIGFAAAVSVLMCGILGVFGLVTLGPRSSRARA